MSRMVLSATVSILILGSNGAGLTIGADDVLHAVPHREFALIAMNEDGTTKWTFDQHPDINQHFEGLNGTVFAITAKSTDDPAMLLALDGSDGSPKWQYEVGNVGIHRCPGCPWLSVVAPDGTVYIASESDESQIDGVNTTIHAVDANGTLKWTSTLSGNIASELTGASSVGPDGTLFVQHEGCSGCLPTVTTALHPDTGAQLWSANFKHAGCDDTMEPLAVLAEGNVIGLSAQGEDCSQSVLSCLSSEGSLNWQVPLSINLRHFMTFLQWSSNRVIYVNGVDENRTCSIKAFDLDGNLLRSLPCQCPDGCEDPPIIDSREAEDVLFTLGYGPVPEHKPVQTRIVYANSGIDGRLLWNLSLPYDEAEYLSLGEDGTLFAQSNGKMSAIRNGDVAWKYEAERVSGQIHSVVMSKDSTTYIQVFEGRPDHDYSPTSSVAAVSVAGDVMWELAMTQPDPAPTPMPVPPAEVQI